MTNTKRNIVQILLTILILAVGAASLWYFFKMRPKAVKESKPFLGVLVKVEAIKKGSYQIRIKTHGTVQANKRVRLMPQVAGTVDKISDSFIEGSFFHKGETLITLNPQSTASLDYTIIKAPFNGVVQIKNVDAGQYVSPGYDLATLIGSDSAYVRVDLPLSDFYRLDIKKKPNIFSIPVDILINYGELNQKRKGVLERYLMELTPKGMMAQLVIKIEDPFGLKAETSENEYSMLPLMIGAFVDVVIPGKMLKDVFIIPTSAIHDQNKVWLAVDGQLEIREVEIAYSEKEKAYISKGLKENENLILSPVKGAAQGLKIRVLGEKSP